MRHAHRPTTATLSFLTVFLIIFGTLYALSETIAPLFAKDRARINTFYQQTPHLDALALGHSHNFALSFEHLNLNGYHFWFPGSDLIETAVFTKTALTHLRTKKQSPRYLLIPLDYTFWAQNNANNPTWKTKRLRYTFALQKLGHLIPFENEIKNAFIAPLLPVIRPDHWSGVFNTAIPLKAPHLAGVTATGMDLNRQQSVWPEDKQAKEARSASVTIDIYRHGLDHNKENKTAFENALTSIISLAGKSTLIFYTPPYTRGYTDFINRNNPELIDKFEQATKALPLRPQDQYWNFATMTSLSQDRSLFYDPTHLNRRGAEVFADVFRERLDELEDNLVRETAKR